jgi:endonuclease YncB( thermonuclease family)
VPGAWAAQRTGRAPLGGRLAPLARALLASGLLPRFPPRPTRYRLGLLRRPVRPSLSLPSRVEQGWTGLRRLASSLVAALGLAALAVILGLSRVRRARHAVRRGNLRRFSLGRAALIGAAALAALALGAAAVLLLPPPARDPIDPSQTAAMDRPGRYRVAWPLTIVDGLTFGPDGAPKTRLAGLEGPGRDAICNDRNGQPWACGLRARAALSELAPRQGLLCEPLGPPAAGVIPARCRGAIDLARELVRAGFARPTSPDPTLDAAAEEARQSERGLWNGGWTIRTAVR